MSDDKEKVDKVKNPVRQELSRFKEVQETTLPQIQKLVESYHRSNERLTAAGQRLALELKRLGEKDTNPWAKQLVQMAEKLNEAESLRAKEFDKPVHDTYLSSAAQVLAADRESFKANRKKVKAALKKIDVRIEKLEKSGKTKDSPEMRELEAKRNELVVYVRQFETVRLCKWMQNYCTVLTAQLTYHKAALAHLTAAQQTVVVQEPPSLPVDTWTAYLDERDKALDAANSAAAGAIGTSLSSGTSTQKPSVAVSAAAPPSPKVTPTTKPAPAPTPTPAPAPTPASAPTPAPPAPTPAPTPASSPAPTPVPVPAAPAAPAVAAAPKARVPASAPAAPSPSAPPVTTSPTTPAAGAVPVSNSKAAVLQTAPKPKPGSIWQLFATEDGEDYYYFNSITAESIWELPASDVAP